MKHHITLTLVLQLAVLVLCDFFADLDKLDIDSKLQEIDRVLAAIDRDEDVDLDKKGSGKAGGEKNVGGEDSDVGDALDALSSLLGGKAECKFTCPNGDVPKPRPGHRPSSNGCGSYGIQIDVDEIPGGTKCCDVHDKCYDTCNNDRATCDKKFKECLYDSCKGLRKTGKISFKDCKAASDIMYSGANTFGCGSYREAQQKACTCQPRDNRSAQNTANKQTTAKKSKDSASVKSKIEKDTKKSATKRQPTRKEKLKDEL
ncbi:PG12B-like protein [Mya arenaria]|uniref:PG12B-like protein n=1 Tax=Mya arenaria TaxID=6604 RepID=A0ABY7DGU1_MYAAR|nr:group XIIB secretory phospholipase A2-like protein [Mya arenaria]WAQ95910.1 PG12B-like protein [Mya arenaria]